MNPITMIQDEELRSLYQTTGVERLQTLQMGLLNLEQNPGDRTVLEVLRREIHSLKGDSRIAGVEVIASLTQQIEDIIKAIQNDDLNFTLEVSDRIYYGLQATGQLLHEAATGESSDVDIEFTSKLLCSVFPRDEASSSQADSIDEVIKAAPSDLYIDDDELREIYRTTCEGRFRLLDEIVNQLESGEVDVATLETLRRETHSLKGDSRIVGLDAIADIVQMAEDIIRSLQDEPVRQTVQVKEGIAYAFAAIRELVQEAITHQSSDVDIALVQTYLIEVRASALEATQTVSTPKDSVQPIASMIEDAELREIFRTTSEERLQVLEANILHLEKNPGDEETLSTLLREAHSLKGDARATGTTAIEGLAHSIEDVLMGIQQHQIELDPTMADSLYQGLDAIAKLVHEAVTGQAANINTDTLLTAIQSAVSFNTADVKEDLAPIGEQAVSMQDISEPEVSEPEEADGLGQISLEGDRSEDDPKTSDRSTPASRGDKRLAEPSSSTRRDNEKTASVRVRMHDLDVLTSQAEELAVTRIQIAQTSSQTQQLLSLWEDWKTGKHKQQPSEASEPSYEERLETLLRSLNSTLQENSSKLEIVAEDLREQIRRLQLLPLSTLFQPLPRLVRDLAKQQSKQVNLVIEGENVTTDKHLLEGIKDSLLHLVRNAVDHGIETPEERAAVGKSEMATLSIRAHKTAISLSIEISDDGQGLDLDRIKQTAIKRGLHTAEELEEMSDSQIQRLILAPGFSTRSFITEISGRGVGLDVLRSQVERLKGSIQIDSTPGEGCIFRIQLSTALSTANVVLVSVHGISFAIPIEFLQMSLLVSSSQIETVDDRAMISIGDQMLPVVDLAEVLELSNSPIYHRVARPDNSKRDRRPCILLKVGEEQAGFLVDRLIDQQEVVSKPLGDLLKRVRNVTGTTILGNGEVCTILNPPDILKSIQRQTTLTSETQRESPRHSPTILLVEDSPTVRIQEQRLLERAGYTVVTAQHGLEGYERLRESHFDAVVSDVEMPHLDGLSLVKRIRQHKEYSNLPIVLVTTLGADADRKRGADAGANAYIRKGRFNQDALLEVLERLV